MLISLSGQNTQQVKLAELLSTHPDTHKRAAHVKEMCEAAGYKMTTPAPVNQGTSNGSGTNTSGSGGKKLKMGKN